MKKTVIFIAIIVLIFASILFCPAEPFVAIFHSDVDSIEQTRIATEWRIKKYELTGYTRELRSLLKNPPDAALGQEVFYTFDHWGLTHQKDFIKIIDGIEADRKPQLRELIARGIVDGLWVDEFENAFKDFDSQAINEIRTEIQKIKN